MRNSNSSLAVRSTFMGGAALAAMVAASPAMAQQTAASAALPGDIIVTATKRSESLQIVPISVQALGSDRLDQHQVSNFDDYAKLLPSVSFQSFGPSQSQLFFRGVSSGGDGLPGGSLPATGLYIDDIPVTTIGSSVDIHIYDIARVEALSGPQGTLFGASSLSGTLRIITNKPDPSAFSAGYDLQGNKYGKGNAGGVVEGFVNIPINDSMAVRLVGFYQHDGGYIDNTLGARTYTLGDDDPTTNVSVDNRDLVKKNFNDIDNYGGRAALRVDLDDNWTVTPAVLFQHQIAHGSFLFDPRAGDLEVHDFKPGRNFDRWVQSALTIEGKISNWDVVYSGGYFDRVIDNQADYSYYTVAYDTIPGYTKFDDGQGGFLDPTQSYHNHQHLTKQTHELRVSSPATDRFRLTAGFFVQRQANENTTDYTIDGLGSIPNSPAVYGDDIFLTSTKIVHRDYAMFGEASFDITPDITLTGGLRGFISKNTLFGFSGYLSNTDPAVCFPSGTDVRPCNNIDKRVIDAGETHRVSLRWQVDDDRMVYATYSTGFRPGGNNRRPGINPYKPDTITNYEIGWKTSWFDRRLRFNGAVFMEDWKKLQYALAPVGDAGVTNIYNAGDARIKGAEADFSLSITEQLILSGSGTYIDSKLRTNFCEIGPDGNPDCASGVLAAPRGTRLPIQPKLKGNLTARYNFTVRSVDAYLQAATQHQSGTRSYLGDIEANLLGPTRAFTTFDFAIGGRVRNWSFEAFIQNAFDKRGQLSINTVCVPIYCGPYGRIYPVKPQFFGVKIGQRF